MDWNHNGKRDAFDRAMDCQIYEDIEKEKHKNNEHKQSTTSFKRSSSGFNFIEGLAYAIIKIRYFLIIAAIYEIICAFMDAFIVGILVTIFFAVVAAGIIKFICYVDKKSSKR